MEQITVELITEHEHEGVLKQIGELLTVDTQTANWLIAHHAAKLTDSKLSKGEQKCVDYSQKARSTLTVKWTA